ncbi:hypothetical protein H5V45_09400 [Nocardioides sp. KIGAM211]|uniref:Uncharacterized protein n=1 Tax=Nocardioides luti TaxID=2761101 RepID=A0A7X0VBU1_9ACTN|nr:hypothetical protein [Nocardioides luti]MBB6627538.1 hypothetical protein [Nocardioides luti]
MLLFTLLAWIKKSSQVRPVSQTHQFAVEPARSRRKVVPMRLIGRHFVPGFCEGLTITFWDGPIETERGEPSDAVGLEVDGPLVESLK